MFPQTYFPAQGEGPTMSYVSPEGGSVPFPPDVQTPVSDQLDDVTYPGSEVTVINRTPDQASNYWPKNGRFVPPNSGYHAMHQGNSHNFTVAPAGRNYPFENESSSTLSCVDGYQVQNQEEAMGGSASFMCPSGQHTADAETLRDGAATMCDCNSDILLGGGGSVTSMEKNLPSSPTSNRKHQHHHHQRKKHTSGRSSRSKKRRGEAEEEDDDEEGGGSFFRRGGRGRSHKASSGGLSHCLSEDDSLSRRQKRSSWGTRRSEYLRRSGKSRSPAERGNCDCAAATCDPNRSWNSMASRHANSLPTLKKRQQNSPPCGAYSERPLRSRKSVNGLFGCNLAAARAEEQWSDTEQASATPAYSGGQLYKTVESGCCGLICLSFMCIVGISCLFSPIGMLILPVVLSFTSQSHKSPVVEEDFVSSSSALSLDDPAFLEGRGGNLDSGGITCNTRCEADLLSLGVKLIILCLTTWKLYVLPVVLVYRRLGIRPLSVSAILNRKLRAGCYKANVKPVNPSSLHPYPIERPFAVTVSVNFLSFGATCAFWVVFVARWMNSAGSSQRAARLQDPTDLFGLDDLSSSRSSQAASLLAYSNLVSFVLTFADTQLVLHILGLILGGLQRVLTEKTVYVVQVVRSPDGQSKSYRVNGGSIDSVASELLYRYLVDFPLYDAQAASAPYRYTRLSSEPSRGPSRSCGGSRKHSLSGLTPSEQEYQIKRCSSTGSSFKFYSLDGPPSETNDCGGGGGDGTSFENLTGSEPDQGYNVNALCADRYHSELDFEFAHRKRWMRLLIATERAFAAIEAVLPTGVRMADCPNLVTPRQAAQMIFPKVIVPLQKYLRLTRLQHLHPPDNVLSRLSTVIAHNCSPETFLTAYSLGQPFTTITAAFVSSGLPFQRRTLNGGGGGGCSGGQAHRPACCQSQLHRSAACGLSHCASAGGGGLEDIHLLQSWCLSSDTLPLSRPLQPGTRFRLSRAGVTLFCAVHASTVFQLKRSASNLPSPATAPHVATSHKNFPETGVGLVAAEMNAVGSVHTKSPTPGRPVV